MARQELIEQVLDNMDYSDLFDVWNHYCSAECDYDNILHYMDDFDGEFGSLFSGMSSIEIIREVKDNYYDFDPDCDYFKGDDIYSLESVSDVFDVVSISDLAEYIDRTDESFGYDDIEKALNSYRDKITEALNNLNLADLVNVYNRFAEMTDGRIVYSMADFDTQNTHFSPKEIALRIHHGKFNPYNDYWWYDGYGNFDSGSFVNDLPIDIDAIADYMIEHDTDFGDPVLESAMSDIA